MTDAKAIAATKLQQLLRQVTPPLLVDLAKQLRGLLVAPEWLYIPEGWAYAERHPEVRGWNVAEVLAVYQAKWPRFVALLQGSGPLGVAHESSLQSRSDLVAHNATMAFAYCLTLAARKRDRIRMLDWGGGIGHYYMLAQALLPEVTIEYHCNDVALLSQYGAQLFPQQHFSSDERCLQHSYDFVLASTSLHYSEQWQELLQRLAQVTTGYLYIAHTPVVQQVPSFVFLQRPYQYGYQTEYLGWCLNQGELLAVAEAAGMRLLREFVYGQQPAIHAAPEQNSYRGYLFAPAHRGGDSV